MCSNNSPKRFSFCPDRLKNIDTWMQSHVDAGRLPGMTVQITRHGEVVYRNKYGLRDVETTQELEFLKERNCDYIQGYIYAKPMSASQIIRYLKD